MKRIVRRVCDLTSSRTGKWGSLILGLTTSATIIAKLPKEQRGQVLGYLASAGVAIGGAVVVGKIIIDKTRAKNQIKIGKAKAMSEAEAEWVKLAGKQMFSGCLTSNVNFGFSSDFENDTAEDSENPYQPKCVSAQDLCANGDLIEDDVLLVGILFAVGETMYLYGVKGSGKSVLILQLCTDLACGTRSAILSPDEDNAIPPVQKVFLYDSENTEGKISQRLGVRKVEAGNNLNIVYNCKFTTVEALIEDIKSRIFPINQDTVICLDNIRTLFTHKLNETETFNLTTELRILSNQVKNNGHNLSVIIVNHPVKSEEGKDKLLQRGYGIIEDTSEAGLCLGGTRFGNSIKFLKNSKNRNHMTEDMVRLVKLETSPYLHFRYVAKAHLSQVVVDKRCLDSPITLYEVARDSNLVEFHNVAREVCINDYAGTRVVDNEDETTSNGERIPLPLTPTESVSSAHSTIPLDQNEQDDEWPAVSPGVCEEDSKMTPQEYFNWFMKEYSIPPQNVSEKDLKALLALPPTARNERNEMIIANYLFGRHDSELEKKLCISKDRIRRIRRELGFKKPEACQKKERRSLPL